jgi:hypothetical protein
VTDNPPRKFYSPTPRLDAGKAQEPATLPPPFDIEAYARETTAPESERRFLSEPTERRRSQLKEPEPDSASALLRTIDDAADARETKRISDDRISVMRECFALGDYADALTMADLILAAKPDNLLAREFRTNCRAALEDVYTFRLGPLDRLPMVVTLPETTGTRAVDQRTRFLLSLIDGGSTLEAIVDMCGLPRLDALRVLHDLVLRGIVAFDRVRARLDGTLLVDG